MNVNDLHTHFKKLEKSQQSKPQKDEGFYFICTHRFTKINTSEKNQENLKNYLSHKENMYCPKLS